MPSLPQVCWMKIINHVVNSLEIWSSQRLGPNSYTPKKLLYSAISNPPTGIPGGFDPAIAGMVGITGGWLDPTGVLTDPHVAAGFNNDVHPDSYQILCPIHGATSPQPVDAVNQTPLSTLHGSGTSVAAQGPFFFNGSWWLIASTNINSTGPQPLRVYKSADGVTGWVGQDATHEPTSQPWLGNSTYAWFWDQVSNLIRFIYAPVAAGNADPTIGFSLKEFDMNNPVSGWGVDHDPLVLPVATTELAMELTYSTSTGITHLVYESPTTFYAFLSGGVWTKDIVVPGNLGTEFMLLDPDGVTNHLFMEAPVNILVYQQILAGGVMGVTQSLNVGYDMGDALGRGVIGPGLILVPVINADPITLVTNPSAWIATDLANPVFSTELVDTDPTNDTDGMYAVWGPQVPAPVTPAVEKLGGRGFVHVTPNRFDACLGREYRLYQEIDRYLYSCHKKPDCFNIPEREWGVDDAEEIPTGPPPNSITLNKQGSVILPAPAAGDVTIFSFMVPLGFDGIILGQFQGYYPGQAGLPPAPNFVQGSGDIIWRIAIDSYYARDCGDMLTSLGSIQSQSPIPGGIWLRCGNLVRYIVNVPNLSGTLAPGQGSILAGVHGYFFPRK